MNIHEYQAKELLAEHGIAIPKGIPAMNVEEAVAGAKQLPGPLYVVKAQIHAGGRGKGKFKELGPDAKGGVRLAKSIEEVEEAAREMLGNTLVTVQTGDAGKEVNRLYVTDGVDIAKEYYLALLVDRASGEVAIDVPGGGGRGLKRAAVVVALLVVVTPALAWACHEFVPVVVLRTTPAGRECVGVED